MGNFLFVFIFRGALTCPRYLIHDPFFQGVILQLSCKFQREQSLVNVHS